MALISFPAAHVRTVQSPMRLVFPEQFRHRAISGKSSPVIIRGAGRWEGEVDFGLRHTRHDSTAVRRINSFMSLLQGTANSFELPLHQAPAATLAQGTQLTVQESFIAGGLYLVRVTGATEGLPVGYRVRVGNRLYECAADMTGGFLQLIPTALPDAFPAQVVWEGVTVRARDREGVGLGPASRDRTFTGPWQILWEEDI